MSWIFEIYLPVEVNDEELQGAVSNCFGIGADRVCVARDVEPTSCIGDVLALRVTVAAPEDPVFPYTIRFFAENAVSDKVALARGISAALGLAIVVDAGPSELEDDWMLVLPNGNYRLVTINDDESFALNAYDINEIMRTRTTERRAA